MDVVAIIVIVALWLIIFATSGQNWLAKRRFNKLPAKEKETILENLRKASEKARLESMRRHEEFMKENIKTPSDHYAHKGSMNDIKDNLEQALKDYGRAIELDPNNDKAYYGRAAVSRQLRFYQSETQDMIMAAKLGNINAKGYLMKKNIKWE